MGFHRKLQRVRVHLAQGGVALPTIEGVQVARNREFVTLRDAKMLDRNEDGNLVETPLRDDYDVARRLIVGMEPVR